MLAVTGYNSQIVQDLLPLLPEGEEVQHLDDIDAGAERMIDRYVFCAGLLRPMKIIEQSVDEIRESLDVNLIAPVHSCETILLSNPNARICIIGSESGFTWSYDGTYAASKSALHRYVETKKLGPKQQLICVAPSIIEDAGMTLRREDTDNLERRRREHPKQRFMKSIEVARLVHFLLYVDEGYLSGQIIRMNGGPA